MSELKVASTIMLTLVLINLLTLTFTIQAVKAEVLLLIRTGKETNDFFNTIEGLPKTSVVIFSYDYALSAATELQPMAEAALFHAKSKGLRSVLVAFWPQGAPLAVNATKKVYGDAFPNVPEYGKDVDGGIVLIGYIPGGSIGMSSFASNISATKSVDHFGTSFSALPLMNRVKTAADFGLFIDWMAGTPGAIQAIQYMHGPYGVKVATGCTLNSYVEVKPYYDAGQLVGILREYQGAYEYEQLVKQYGWTPTLLPPIQPEPHSLGLVPYDGMTLKWVGHWEDTQDGTRIEGNSTLLYVYTKLTETTFQARELIGNSTHVVNATTRIIISEDPYMIRSTSHWIFTDVSIGDGIEILWNEYKVTSLNEDVFVPSIDGGINVKCIKLERGPYDTHVVYTESFYYDVNTGIKIKWVRHGQTQDGTFSSNSEQILTETGIDMDKDGLTDCKELFATFTNPTKFDTDGDFWNDSMDFIGTNSLVPNGIIVLVIVLGGFIAYLFLKRRKATLPQ